MWILSSYVMSHVIIHTNNVLNCLQTLGWISGTCLFNCSTNVRSKLHSKISGWLVPEGSAIDLSKNINLYSQYICLNSDFDTCGFGKKIIKSPNLLAPKIKYLMTVFKREILKIHILNCNHSFLKQENFASTIIILDILNGCSLCLHIPNRTCPRERLTFSK